MQMKRKRKIARYEKLTRINRDVEVTEEDIVFLEEGVHLGGLDAEMLASDGEAGRAAEEDDLLVVDVDHGGYSYFGYVIWRWEY